MQELKRLVKSDNHITHRPTVPRRAAVRIESYPTLKEKNPSLIATGSCVCGRKFSEHTFECITTFLDTRDPKCGCNNCHIVNE